jgi:hypothetical protein
MWKSALGYALSNTNYGITNMHNLYNHIISTMDLLNEEQNAAMIDSLILHLGKSFYSGFRSYVITKLPNSKHLPLINRIL